MTIQIIKNEAKILERRAWDAANKIGLERTRDTAERMRLIMSGLIVEGSTKITSEPKEELFVEIDGKAEKEFQAATTNEKSLALCLMAVWHILDDEKTLDESAIGLLCEGYCALGTVLQTTGIGGISLFSRLGKAGAESRHKPMKILKHWTLQLYDAGNWPSANRAAYDLKEQVLEHGRTIGAHLSEQNAQNTIAEWIRKGTSSR